MSDSDKPNVPEHDVVIGETGCSPIPAIVFGSCYGSGAGVSFVGVTRSIPAGTTDLKPEHGIDYASLFDL